MKHLSALSGRAKSAFAGSLSYLILSCCFLLAALPSKAQVSLASFGNTYTQTFNTLAQSGTANAWTDNTTIAGWYSNRTTYIGDAGSSTTGALFSYGTASNSDRALGAITSGTTPTVIFGVRLVNNTTKTIKSLTLTFRGEQWRQTANAQTLVFESQVGASSLTTGTWVANTSFNFLSPKTGTAGPLDGNAVGNFLNISGALSVTVNPGQEVWLRWTKTGSTSPGIAIDDINITPEGAPSQDNTISFPTVNSSSLNISWTNGDGAARLVKINTVNTFTDPTDNTTYTANSVYGSGEQAIYNGTSNNVTVTNLSPSTTYFVRVYAYNTPNANIFYNTSSATLNPNSQMTSNSVTPTITVTGSVAAFQTISGTPSFSKNYSFSAVNLTAPVVLTPLSGNPLPVRLIAPKFPFRRANIGTDCRARWAASNVCTADDALPTMFGQELAPELGAAACHGLSAPSLTQT